MNDHPATTDDVAPNGRGVANGILTRTNGLSVFDCFPELDSATITHGEVRARLHKWERLSAWYQTDRAVPMEPCPATCAYCHPPTAEPQHPQPEPAPWFMPYAEACRVVGNRANCGGRWAMYAGSDVKAIIEAAVEDGIVTPRTEPPSEDERDMLKALLSLRRLDDEIQIHDAVTDILDAGFHRTEKPQPDHEALIAELRDLDNATVQAVSARLNFRPDCGVWETARAIADALEGKTHGT